jgi:uncharacterized protein
MELLISHASIISERLKELGFIYVAMDLSGYRSGSMNKVLELGGSAI